MSEKKIENRENVEGKFENQRIIELTGKKVILDIVEPAEKFSIYLKEREQVWLDMIKMHQKNLWNGKVYTLESDMSDAAGNITLVLSWCEYKDIVYKKKVGTNSIKNRFGDNHVANHIFTTIVPITTDRKFIFGKKGKATFEDKGLVDLIGGSLNKDEMLIKSMEDIHKFTTKELQEETNLNIDSKEIRLIKLCGYNNSWHFFYTCQLSTDSQILETRFDNNEIEKILAIKPIDIKHYSGQKSKEFIFHSNNTNYEKLQYLFI